MIGIQGEKTIAGLLTRLFFRLVAIAGVLYFLAPAWSIVTLASAPFFIAYEWLDSATD